MTKEEFIVTFNEISDHVLLTRKWQATDNPRLDAPILVDEGTEEIIICAVPTGYNVEDVSSIKYHSVYEEWGEPETDGDEELLDIFDSEDYISIYFVDEKILYFFRGEYRKNYKDIGLAFPIDDSGISLEGDGVYEYFRWINKDEENKGKEFRIEGGVLKAYYGIGPWVEIPDEVVEIGPNAFAGNDSIWRVSAGENLKKIHEDAFFDCRRLGVMILPGLEQLDDRAIWECKLEEIEVSASLKDRILGDEEIAEHCKKFTFV